MSYSYADSPVASSILSLFAIVMLSGCPSTDDPGAEPDGTGVVDGTGDTTGETSVEDGGVQDTGPVDASDAGDDAAGDTARDVGDDGGGESDGTDVTDEPDGEGDVEGDTSDIVEGDADATTPDTDAGGSTDEGPWEAVEIYSDRNCAVDKDNKVCCWKENDNNNEATADPEGTLESVRVSFYTNCALEKSTGHPYCWGEYTEITGMANPPEQEFSDLALGAGGQEACGIGATGKLTCWGDAAPKPEDVPETKFRSIASGSQVLCGVRLTDNKVECWDHHDTDVIADWDQPVPDGGFEQLDFGSTHVCGLNQGGGIECWGDAADDSAMKDQPGGGLGFIDVAAGGNWSCGVKVSGEVVCWGDDADGVVSDVPSGSFVDVSGPATPGGEHACAVTENGHLKCWGDGPGAPPKPEYCANGAGQ